MAMSSEQLRQTLLANLANRATPRTLGGAFGDLGSSIATAIQLRREVPRLQEQERQTAAREQADRIGQQVGLRDALVSAGIDPGAAGGIAAAPENVRTALLNRLPRAPSPLEEARTEAVQAETKATRARTRRDDRQFQAGQQLAQRVLGGEFGELSDEQRLSALSASITGDTTALAGVIDPGRDEFQIVGNAETGLHRFNKATGELQEVISPQAPIADPTERGKREQSIRKEAAALPAIKNYRQALPAVRAAIDSIDLDTKAADLDIVFAVMKAVDPTSVVRESEQEVAIKAGSPAARFEGIFNEVAGGGRLTAQQRSELMEVALGRVSSFRQSAESDLDQFLDIAAAENLDPERIIPRLEPLPVLGAAVAGGEAQGAIPARPGAGQPSQVFSFDAEGNLVQ